MVVEAKERLGNNYSGIDTESSIPSPEIKKRFRVEGGFLPVEIINVLPQSRKTIEKKKVASLAINIKEVGLIHPISVAPLDESECQEYVDFVNRVSQTNITLSDLVYEVVDGKKVFHITIAGHYRFSAVQINQDPTVEVRLFPGISAKEALKIQLAENSYTRVPPHEEARAWQSLFIILREDDPEYSLSKFAHEVNKDEGTVRNGLYFCDLPLPIQRYVEEFYVKDEEEEEGKKKKKEKKKERVGIPYSFAIQITRVQRETNATEEELMHWAKLALVGKYKFDEFREMVTKYILDIKFGQTTLSLFDSKEEKVMRKTLFLRVVLKEFVPGTWEKIHYNRRIQKLFEDGILGPKDSPFSLGSPTRIYGAWVSEVEGFLPHIINQLPKAKRERAPQILAAAGISLDLLKEVLPDDLKDGTITLSRELEQIVYHSNHGQATKPTAIMH